MAQSLDTRGQLARLHGAVTGTGASGAVAASYRRPGATPSVLPLAQTLATATLTPPRSGKPSNVVGDVPHSTDVAARPRLTSAEHKRLAELGATPRQPPANGDGVSLTCPNCGGAHSGAGAISHVVQSSHSVCLSEADRFTARSDWQRHKQLRAGCQGLAWDGLAAADGHDSALALAAKEFVEDESDDQGSATTPHPLNSEVSACATGVGPCVSELVHCVATHLLACGAAIFELHSCEVRDGDGVLRDTHTHPCVS